MGCFRTLCSTCAKDGFVTYEHPYEDFKTGIFCHECDTNPPKEVKKLHTAYKKFTTKYGNIHWNDRVHQQKKENPYWADIEEIIRPLWKEYNAFPGQIRGVKSE